jgi:hypothetical protein
MKEKSSSYLTLHNPPVSQSTRLELVDSKKFKGATLTEKRVRTEKGVREGDVREVGGKSTRISATKRLGADICSGREIFFLID